MLGRNNNQNEIHETFLITNIFSITIPVIKHLLTYDMYTFKEEHTFIRYNDLSIFKYFSII